MMQVEQEDNQANQPDIKDLKAQEYQKRPLSISELHKIFSETENFEAQMTYNRVLKEFREYVAEFSIIKNRFTQIDKIKSNFRQFRDLQSLYEKNVEANYPTLDDRDFDRKIKKFKKLEIKALNLNLDDPISIRQTCDAKREIDDEKLNQIAEIISSDYHE